MGTLNRLLIGVIALATLLLACNSVPTVHITFDDGRTAVQATAGEAVSIPEAVAASTPAPTPTWSSSAPKPTYASMPVATMAPIPTALPPAMLEQADAEEALLINIYERVSPSVVSIQSIIAVAQIQMPEMPQGIPTRQVPNFPQQPYQRSGEGSGFVIDFEGHIVTNNHVVADTTDLFVTFFDGSTVPAVVVGTDPDTDLAVLKVDVAPGSLRPVAWGDSDTVKVGQRAIALGNPFGYENTLTSGIISGLSRSLPAESGYRIPEIIQTDAAINPGNSGGPLLNSKGEVIGVNTAIVPSVNLYGQSSFLGVGFSIPSNQVQRVVPVLIAEGHFDHPWIGFSGMDVLPDIAAEMGLPGTTGALVVTIIPGGPAQKAGLRGGSREIQVLGQPVTVGGDVILAINGQPVDEFDDILAYLASEGEVGQVVQLSILRDGTSQTVPITLGKRPQTAPVQ